MINPYKKITSKSLREILILNNTFYLDIIGKCNIVDLESLLLKDDIFLEKNIKTLAYIIQNLEKENRFEVYQGFLSLVNNYNKYSILKKDSFELEKNLSLEEVISIKELELIEEESNPFIDYEDIDILPKTSKPILKMLVKRNIL